MYCITLSAARGTLSLSIKLNCHCSTTLPSRCRHRCCLSMIIWPLPCRFVPPATSPSSTLRARYTIHRALWYVVMYAVSSYRRKFRSTFRAIFCIPTGNPLLRSILPLVSTDTKLHDRRFLLPPLMRNYTYTFPLGLIIRHR